VVFTLVQGYVYGVDGSNGSPIWHAPVGLTSPFAPVAISGADPSLLLFDARHDELVKLDARSGNLIWRQSTGEPVTSPPLVLGRQVLQVVPSGKLILIDLETGELRGTLMVNRPLAGTPATDEAGQYFYLTGARDVLYVISRDPFECVSVEYLGHPSGSIACAPARLANFLIVPENRELWEGRWSVFVIEQNGEKLRLAQTVKIPGWTWQTPESQGTIVWSLTDRGALTAFAMGSEDSKEPLTRVSSTVPDARPSGPAYAHARGDREFWISASRIGRFDLEAELGSLTPTWTIERAGQAAGPIQTAGRLAVFQHQYEEGPGVTLWGVDPASGSVQWKTVLGAPWPLPPSPSPDGQRLTTLANDGPEVSISPDLLSKGGFLEWPLRRPGYFSLPSGPVQRLEREGLTVLVPSPDADHLLVREDQTSEFRRVDLPAPLGARPVFWGPDLFVPGLDGRAYLVDPKTGAAKAEPYVPAFDTEEPTRWRAPVFLNDAVVLANQAGQVRRLARVTEPRLRLDVVGEVVDLKSTLESDPATTTDSVIVVTDDGRVRSLAGRDLSSLGAWNLEVPRAFGPLSLGERAFLIDKGGGVMAFGADGDRAWAAGLQDEPPVGAPVVRDNEVWFLSRNGALQKRSLEDGSPIDRYDLGILPSGGLVSVGPNVIVRAAPGTVRLLKPTDASAGGAP
jgi:outer membrane protein assembly factor BamB